MYVTLRKVEGLPPQEHTSVLHYEHTLPSTQHDAVIVIIGALHTMSPLSLTSIDVSSPFREGGQGCFQ